MSWESIPGLPVFSKCSMSYSFCVHCSQSTARLQLLMLVLKASMLCLSIIFSDIRNILIIRKHIAFKTNIIKKTSIHIYTYITCRPRHVKFYYLICCGLPFTLCFDVFIFLVRSIDVIKNDTACQTIVPSFIPQKMSELFILLSNKIKFYLQAQYMKEKFEEKQKVNQIRATIAGLKGRETALTWDPYILTFDYHLFSVIKISLCFTEELLEKSALNKNADFGTWFCSVRIQS